MNTFQKNSILNKFSYTELPISMFSEESLQDKDFIMEDKVHNYVDNFKEAHNRLSNFSSCFVNHNDDHLSYRKKSSPGRKSSFTWRKHSEVDRRLSLCNLNLSEVREMEFKISRKPSFEWARRNVKCELSISSGEINLSIENDATATKISQILNLMKIPKKKNKRNNLNVLAKVNEKIKVDMELPIWYINCTKSLESKTDLLFGPFSSNQLIHFYELKNINENTELRINPEINIDLTNVKSRDFRIKNIAKVFNLKDKGEKKEQQPQSLNRNEGFYCYEYADYNTSIYDDTYNNKKNGTTNKKITSGTNYNNDEYYYDLSMNKKNNRKSFLFINIF